MGQYLTNRCRLRTWRFSMSQYVTLVLLAVEFWEILLMLKIILVLR